MQARLMRLGAVSLLGVLSPRGLRRASTVVCEARRQGTRVSTGPPSPYKKRRCLLTFGYTGTGYWGLQSQTAEGDPERPTVSDVIRRALLDTGAIAPTNFVPLTRTKWSLASRTDKGVHAACAAASCNIETLEEDLVFTPAVEEGAVAHWQLSDDALARATHSFTLTSPQPAERRPPQRKFSPSHPHQRVSQGSK